MPLPSPATLPLMDATKLLRQQQGIGAATVTTHHLLSWAAQGLLGLHVPVGDKLLKLPITEAQAVRLARGEWVPLDVGQLEGGNPRSRPKPLLVQQSELVVHTAELQALAAQHLCASGAAEPATAEPKPEPEAFDPADLPEELDIARIAFTAVRNGYGAANATFKNRLLAYLGEHHPKLSDEARQRIGTVANPDKAAGRRKGA